MKKKDIANIREQINGKIGNKVRIRANKGRKKFVEKEGIIKKTYPSIFIVSVDQGMKEQTVSYSYADVITHTVELTLVEAQ